jgi:hypothetical protein
MIIYWIYFCLAFFFYHGATALVGQGLLITEDSWSYSDTPHSVGLVWTSAQPDPQTSTWHHTTLKTDFHAPDGIRNHNLSKQAAADRRVATGIGYIWLNNLKYIGRRKYFFYLNTNILTSLWDFLSKT